VVVLATACSDDSGGDAAPTTTSSTTTSTTSPSTISTTVVPTTTEAPTTTVSELTDEEQIIAVVERFYEVIVEANNPPILDNPIWDEVANGEFATDLRGRAVQSLEERHGLRNPENDPPPVNQPEMAFMEPGSAILDICHRDDAILFDLDTGETINDEVIFNWTQLWITKVDGQWLIDRANSVEQFDSEASCVDSY